MNDTNNLYNLMLQYTVEARSLWRIEKDYKNDADGDDATRAFWEKMIADKKAHIEELRALIRARV